MGWHVVCIGDEKFVRRWEDNIRMGLAEIRWEGLDWLHLALDMDQCRLL